MKQYIGISRDHSGSMAGITRPAMNDYNSNIEVIREEARAQDIDTVVSVVRCGDGRQATVAREVVNSSISVLKPLTSYQALASGTPLWDSVGELIDILKNVPDALDPEVTFLVMVITDGEENQSRRWTAPRLSEEIRRLVASDRWSFVFRVPRGHARTLSRKLGISEGNILEWDQTTRGVEIAGSQTNTAFRQYFSDRKAGVKSTNRFYANLVQVPASEVKAALSDVSKEVSYFPVKYDADIRTVLEAETRQPLVKGSAFYQLTKTEDVQDHKAIAVRDKTTHQTYSGHDARTLLGLPLHGEIRLSPGNNGNFDVFVQSTSTNRKLIAGTEVMYWPRMAR